MSKKYKEGVYFASISLFIVKGSGKSGQEPEAGADAEAIEGCCLLACSLSLLSLLSYRTQDYQPRDGSTHNGLAPSLSITN